MMLWAFPEINIATYQAVSGAGKRAIAELGQQSIELLSGKPVSPTVMPKQIAFNVLPHIDEFQENGYTREEMKMIWETQKILGDDTILHKPNLRACASVLWPLRGFAYRNARKDYCQSGSRFAPSCTGCCRR